MLRVKPAGRGSEVITLPQQSTSSKTETTLPIASLGPGVVLGDRSRFHEEERPLERSQEAPIRERIARLMSRGVTLKISDLVGRLLHFPFVEPTHRAIEGWVHEFQEIDSEQKERRSVAIAILIHRILRQALLRDDRSQQREVIAFEQHSKEVLRMLLPLEENVDSFLDDCEVLLHEERICKDEARHIDQILAVEEEAIEGATQRVDQALQESCSRIKGRMKEIARRKEEQEGDLERAMLEAQAEIEQVRTHTIQQAEAIRRLSEEEREHLSRLQAMIQACKNML